MNAFVQRYGYGRTARERAELVVLWNTLAKKHTGESMIGPILNYTKTALDFVRECKKKGYGNPPKVDSLSTLQRRRGGL